MCVCVRAEVAVGGIWQAGDLKDGSRELRLDRKVRDPSARLVERAQIALRGTLTRKDTSACLVNVRRLI